MDSTDAEAAYSKSRQLIRQRKYTEAVTLLTRLASVGFSRSKVLETLAVAHSMLGEFELAAEALEQVLKISPERTSASVNLGAVYNRLKRHDDALVQLNHALKTNWKCVEAYYNLGIAYRKKKNYGDARMMFQEAVRLRPEMTDGWLQLGTVLLETSNAQLAASSFRKVLARKPDHEKARSGLRAAETLLRKAAGTTTGSPKPVDLAAQPTPPVNRPKKLSLQDRSTIQSSGMEIEQAINHLLEWFQTESDALLHGIRRQISGGIRPGKSITDFCANLSSELENQSKKASQLDRTVGWIREYHQRYVDGN